MLYLFVFAHNLFPKPVPTFRDVLYAQSTDTLVRPARAGTGGALRSLSLSSLSAFVATGERTRGGATIISSGLSLDAILGSVVFAGAGKAGVMPGIGFCSIFGCAYHTSPCPAMAGRTP